MNHSSTFNQVIDILSNMQLRENQYEKNIISLIHKNNVTKEFIKYQINAIVININDYHNIHDL